MNTINISKAGIEDLTKLQTIGRQTFYETFAEGNTEENMKEYLEESFSDKKLGSELNDLNSQFYLAMISTKLIGYLKVNFAQAQTELKDITSLEIERIYVLKEYHGQKAGQLLFDKAIEIAKQVKASYVWLGVWEKNARAISFYKKKGFTEFDKHIFKLGADEQTDLLMRLELGHHDDQQKLK